MPPTYDPPMKLNVDRIRALASDPTWDVPDISDEQADAICRILASEPGQR